MSRRTSRRARDANPVFTPTNASKRSSPPGFPASLANVTACVTDPSARTPACFAPASNSCMACFCIRVLASVPNPPSRAAPVQSPLAPSPNPSVLLHRSASPPSWCCSCAIALFWSRITRSLRRSSSASAKPLGISSYVSGEPPSSLLKRPPASPTKTRTS